MFEMKRLGGDDPLVVSIRDLTNFEDPGQIGVLQNVTLTKSPLMLEPDRLEEITKQLFKDMEDE